MQPLTKRQREILDYLDEFIDQRGYAPSLEEIGRRFGLSSLATVHKHLTNLQEKGFIKRAWNRSRSVELVPTRVGTRAVDLPLLGHVAAGAPIEAVVSDETVANVLRPNEVPPSSGRRPKLTLTEFITTHKETIVATDDGASRVGEYGIGVNRHIQSWTGDLFFDEKIVGTTHIALGRAYPECGGVNQSAIHWDIVKDLRPGPRRARGTVPIDGEIVIDGAELRLPGDRG